MRQEIYFQFFFNCQIWLNQLWNYQPELHDKKNLNDGRIAAWQNLLPIYLFLTGDPMKRIIGHYMCGICQCSLADATHVS
jgi:hypothetical protein